MAAVFAEWWQKGLCEGKTHLYFFTTADSHCPTDQSYMVGYHFPLTVVYKNITNTERFDLDALVQGHIVQLFVFSSDVEQVDLASGYQDSDEGAVVSA